MEAGQQPAQNRHHQKAKHATADMEYEIAKAERTTAKPEGGMKLLKGFWSDLAECSLHRAINGDKVCSQMWYGSKIMKSKVPLQMGKRAAQS